MRENNTTWVKCEFCHDQVRIEPENGEFEEYKRALTVTMNEHVTACEEAKAFN